MTRPRCPVCEETPEPDWHCQVCDTGVRGTRCPECGRDAETAEEARADQMAEKIGNFLTMLEEQDAFNFGEDQISEITYEGDAIKLIPRFRLSMSNVLTLPGVEDVALSREGEEYILIRYNPDRDENLRDFIEQVQLLANRHGPSRAARMVEARMGDDDQWKERYDVDSTESVATGRIASLWKYLR